MIWNVRLQTAQEFHIVADLGDSVLNNERNTHRRRRAKEGQNNSIISLMPTKEPVLLTEVYATPPNSAPCVHNPAGTSPVGKAHLRQVGLPVFWLWLAHQPLPCVFIA